ncbi:MAG: hypothetical protein AAFY65_06505 [Pseudomonadota bacterium]
MKTIGLATLVAFATAFGGTSALAHKHGHHHHPHAHGVVTTAPVSITVSCARYVSRQVIWDRPMPVFLDSLMAAGYSPERAESIGNRVCRDERYVGDVEAAGQAMRNILATNPPARR